MSTSTQTKPTTIERLRESMEAYEAKLKDKAQAAARAWIDHAADAEPLEHLDHLQQSLGEDWAEWFDKDDRLSAAKRLHAVMFPDDDPREADLFWAQVLDREYLEFDPPVGFVRAFAEACVEIWDEVQAEI